MNSTVSLVKTLTDIYDFKNYILIEYPGLVSINYTKTSRVLKMTFSSPVVVKTLVAYIGLYQNPQEKEVPSITTISVTKTTSASPQYFETIASTIYNGTRYTVYVDNFVITSRSDYQDTTYEIRVVDITNNVILTEGIFTNSIFEDRIMPIDTSKLSELLAEIEIQAKGDAVSIQRISIAYRR